MDRITEGTFSKYYLTCESASPGSFTVPIGVEIDILCVDFDLQVVQFILPGFRGDCWEVPLDGVEERVYETRLIKTRSLRNSGTFKKQKAQP